MIELVIVLMTISIVAAIAVPHYAGALARYRLKAAAQRVAVDVQLVADSARATSTSRTIEFDLGTNAYRIANLTNLDRTSSTWSVNLGEAPYGTTMISADFGGDARIVFDGHGMPDSGGQIVLRHGSLQATLLVDRTSGRVTIQ
jgi:type II secretory pathway pseudopilin PulG